MFGEDWPGVLREAREGARVAFEANEFGVGCVNVALMQWAAIWVGDRKAADQAGEQYRTLKARLGGCTIDDWHAVVAIDHALAFSTPEEAAARGAEVVARLLAHRSVTGEVLGRRSLGRALSRLQRFDDAEQQFQESLGVAERVGGNTLSARTLLAWAEMCQERGDLGRAREHRRTAASLIT
jgi:hypothetical protein